MEGRYMWMDSRQVAVENTVSDKILNVAIVQLTAIGQEDVLVCQGQVPAEKLASIYEQVDQKQRSFIIEMKNAGDGASAGNLKVKISFTTELLANQPEGNQAAQ